MDLRLKSPSNEFVENGLENWALVNQTNLRMDSDVERKKKKKKRESFNVEESMRVHLNYNFVFH